MSFTSNQNLGYPPIQDNWRFCNKCHGMFFNGFPDKGTCPRGGGHDASGSFNYNLPFDIQDDWRFCDKCHAMFFNGFPDKGICPKGGDHNAFGFNFGLVFDIAGGQDNWRFCNKCHVMFFNGLPDKGVCPRGGGHDASSSLNYNLMHDEIQGPHFAPAGQPDWRFCNKCHAMFFNSFPDKGVCPRGGGHDASGSFNFVLRHDEIGGPRQPDWRFCDKCHGMFFDGFPDKGVCPRGGGHNASGFNFNLVHDNPQTGQPDWRFCDKCHGMFFDGFPDKGVCPQGGGHNASGFNFSLPFGDPPHIG